MAYARRDSDRSPRSKTSSLQIVAIREGLCENVAAPTKQSFSPIFAGCKRGKAGVIRWLASPVAHDWSPPDRHRRRPHNRARWGEGKRTVATASRRRAGTPISRAVFVSHTIGTYRDFFAFGSPLHPRRGTPSTSTETRTHGSEKNARFSRPIFSSRSRRREAAECTPVRNYARRQPARDGTRGGGRIRPRPSSTSWKAFSALLPPPRSPKCFRCFSGGGDFSSTTGRRTFPGLIRRIRRGESIEERGALGGGARLRQPPKRKLSIHERFTRPMHLPPRVDRRAAERAQPIHPRGRLKEIRAGAPLTTSIHRKLVTHARQMNAGARVRRRLAESVHRGDAPNACPRWAQSV